VLSKALSSTDICIQKYQFSVLKWSSIDLYYEVLQIIIVRNKKLYGIFMFHEGKFSKSKQLPLVLICIGRVLSMNWYMHRGVINVVNIK
jgi:hypothetical protein